MQIIDAETVATRLQPEALVAALARMFRDGCSTPVRHHHTVPVPGAPDATLLLMPAWRAGAHLGIKIVTIFPGNSARSLPAVSAAYVLVNADTGTVQAMIDGGELTARRTAATSALAAQYLARRDAKSLLIVGTGRVARQLAQFHVALRPALTSVRIWGRSLAHAASMAEELRGRGIDARVASNLPAAAAESDIISAATLATEPLIQGRWIRPGTHVDLVGGYTPSMREADDALIGMARVFVDTRDGAMHEAGDIASPIASGVLLKDAVFDLHDLCRGVQPGRQHEEEITVFKSVGAALEDLAAAILILESAPRRT
ncbi:MAG TPA: ornithine cyclodeaminase family protein [Steroidobacteraceae bacterium]|nr:ornithine cyclodeaminase family protein [Steroidobacteraceae bacterium]